MPGTSYKQHVETSIENLGNRKRKGRSDAEVRATRHDTTRTAQALDTITVEPVKKTREDVDKFAEPIATAAPQGDNLDTTSLTAIEG